jgi:hypothetical protein
MDRASLPSDNPREWARPGPEGDVWHDYWEPEGVSAPLARKLAILYIAVVPIAIAVNLIFSQRYHSWGALIGAIACTVGLIRIADPEIWHLCPTIRADFNRKERLP